MDPNHSAQDVARCDLCEITLAQNYCDFCHIYLCKPCIGEHVFDDYRKHKIVLFKDRRSTLIYPECETHQDQTCKYQCRECKIVVCSHCIVSEQHKEHPFLELKEVFLKKREIISYDLEEIDKELLPEYDEIAIDLEHEISRLDVEYQNLATEMLKQREELHKEVDNIINQMEKTVDEIKEKHHHILAKHLDEIKQLQSHLRQASIDLNEMVISNEVYPTINYNSKNQDFFKLPAKLSVSMPKFIPKQIDMEELCCLIGKLTPLSMTQDERVFTTQTPNTSVRKLLEEPENLITIKTEHENLRNVTCLDEEQIWTSGETADIKCFNIQSVLVNTIKTKSGQRPNDIAVDNDGAVLYSDGKRGAVCKARKGHTEEIIKLQGWTPFNLCVASSGTLLVTMFSNDGTQSKVVRYSGSTDIQTIQFDDEGKPLYSGNNMIKYISENRNLDICVADCKAGAVVVVSQAGKLRFRYTGNPFHTKTKLFMPRGITTDSQSCILTSDTDNYRIHILDSDGHLLCYIDKCDLKNPFGLCVDRNDSLYVCEFKNGNVKKIRYWR